MDTTMSMGMFGNSHPKLAKVRSLKGVKSAQVVNHLNEEIIQSSHLEELNNSMPPTVQAEHIKLMVDGEQIILTGKANSALLQTVCQITEEKLCGERITALLPSRSGKQRPQHRTILNETGDDKIILTGESSGRAIDRVYSTIICSLPRNSQGASGRTKMLHEDELFEGPANGNCEELMANSPSAPETIKTRMKRSKSTPVGNGGCVSQRTVEPKRRGSSSLFTQNLFSRAITDIHSQVKETAQRSPSQRVPLEQSNTSSRIKQIPVQRSCSDVTVTKKPVNNSVLYCQSEYNQYDQLSNSHSSSETKNLKSNVPSCSEATKAKDVVDSCVDCCVSTQPTSLERNPSNMADTGPSSCDDPADTLVVRHTDQSMVISDTPNSDNLLLAVSTEPQNYPGYQPVAVCSSVPVDYKSLEPEVRSEIGQSLPARDSLEITRSESATNKDGNAPQTVDTRLGEKPVSEVKSSNLQAEAFSGTCSVENTTTNEDTRSKQGRLAYERAQLLEMCKSLYCQQYPASLIINHCEILIEKKSEGDYFSPSDHRLASSEYYIRSGIASLSHFSGGGVSSRRQYYSDSGLYKRNFSSTTDPYVSSRSWGDAQTTSKASSHSHKGVTSSHARRSFATESANTERSEKVTESCVTDEDLDDVFQNGNRFVPGSQIFTNRSRESHNDEYIKDLLSYYESRQSCQ